MANQIFARQFREQDLRTGGGAAHQLAAIELHEILAVVFMERKTSAIGSGRFGQSAERFHESIYPVRAARIWAKRLFALSSATGVPSSLSKSIFSRNSGAS